MTGFLRRNSQAPSNDEAESVAPAETTADGTTAAADGVDVDATETGTELDAATDTGATPTTKSVRWLPVASIRKGYGGSSVSFALAGLATSFFVGWAFPLALIGITLGIIAIRKPEESSRLGAWGIALGALATIYSAGWLWWAGTQLHWFG